MLYSELKLLRKVPNLALRLRYTQPVLIKSCDASSYLSFFFMLNLEIITSVCVPDLAIACSHIALDSEWRTLTTFNFNSGLLDQS